MRKTAQQGFTLIEMAIVLVVIGLILGMVFKGRELIASAKVKNANAAYNKVIAGMNTYLDRYGVYPGDGCSSATPSGPTATECQGTKNGIVDDANEKKAFFHLLTTTGILTAADKKSSLGDTWYVGGSATATWIYANSTDVRLACDLDRIADDGNSTSGSILSNGTTPDTAFTGQSAYNNGDDCWVKSGTVNLLLKVLP